MGFLKFLKRDKSKGMGLGMGNMEELDIPPPPPAMKNAPKTSNFQGINSPQDKFPDMPELPDLPEIQDEMPLPDMGKDIGMPKDFPKFDAKSMGMGDIGNLPPFDEDNFQIDNQEDLPPLDAPEDFGQNAPSKLPLLEQPKDLPPFRMIQESREPRRTLFPQPRFRLNMEGSRPLFGNKEPDSTRDEMPRPRLATNNYYQKFENKAVKDERSLLEHKKTKGPIFVRVERFRGIAANVAAIRSNAKMGDETITKLSEMDLNREKVFEKWHGIMMDMQKKFIFVDKTLFKGDKR